jgi:hypothetical protein
MAVVTINASRVEMSEGRARTQGYIDIMLRRPVAERGSLYPDGLVTTARIWTWQWRLA